MSDSKCSIRVYYSNSLQKLTQKTASILKAQKSSNPFEFQKILLMSTGMKSYLEQNISRSMGVCAGVDFEQVWDFIWKLYRNVTGADKHNRFDVEHLTWMVFSVLQKQLSNPSDKVLKPLFDYFNSSLNLKDEELKLFTLSGQIADVFDKYQMYRPDWIEVWNSADDFENAKDLWKALVLKEVPPEQKAAAEDLVDKNLWQVKIFRELKSQLAAASLNGLCEVNPSSLLDRSSVISSLISLLEKDPQKLKEKLPKQVFIFGISSLPTQVLKLIIALGSVVDVHFMYLCAEDLKNKDPDNPLILSLSRQGREFIEEFKRLGISEDSFENVSAEDESSKEDGTVLNKLKAQLFTGKKPSTPAIVSKADRSVQIRSCHTIKRELEVLRDEILSTFYTAKESGKKDAPRNMLVMVPSVEQYAPYIEAVFGSVKFDNNGSLNPNYVYYTTSDLGVGIINQVAEAVIKFLEAASEGVNASLINDLLSIKAVARKFGLSPEDHQVVIKWLNDTSIHFGLDDEDANEQTECTLLESDPWPWTVTKGIDRLLDGFIYGAEGTDSASTINSSDYMVLNKLCSFIDKLKFIRRTFKDETKSAKEWCDLIISEILSECFAVTIAAEDEFTDKTAFEKKAVEKLLYEIKESVSHLSEDPKISIKGFIYKLKNSFERLADSSNYMRGGITFCSFMPMRAVPFDHIYLLGLNDKDFPRKDRLPSFNLLGSELLTRVNDRSTISDDRYTFLESIISAQKTLYLSYLGEDPFNKAQLNPSVVLKELKDYLCLFFKGEDEALDLDEKTCEKLRSDLFIRKELINAYDPENYIDPPKDDLRSMSSFNEYACPEESYGQKTDNLPLGCIGYNNENPWKSELGDSIKISIDDLISYFKKPNECFLKQFNLNIKDYSEKVPDDTEPFDIEDNLQKGSLLKELVEVALESEDESALDALLDKRAKEGLLPYGIFAKALRDKLKTDAKKIADEVNALDKDHKDLHSLDHYSYKTQFSSAENVKVELCGQFDSRSNLIGSFYSSKMKEHKFELSLKVFLHSLMYSNSAECKDPQPICVMNNQAKREIFDSEKIVSAGDGDNNALSLLDRMLDIYVKGHSMPVPFNQSLLDKVREQQKNPQNSPQKNILNQSGYTCIPLDSQSDDFFSDTTKIESYLFTTKDLFTPQTIEQSKLSKPQLELLNEMVDVILKIEKLVEISIVKSSENKSNTDNGVQE